MENLQYFVPPFTFMCAAVPQVIQTLHKLYIIVIPQNYDAFVVKIVRLEMEPMKVV